MEIASFVLSIISITISVIIAIIELQKSKKINDINLDFDLLKDTIKLYLTELLPGSLQKLSFVDDKLTNITYLQKDLLGFLRSFSFLRYSDNVFYEEFKKAIQELEDFIVENEDKSFSFSDQGDIHKRIIEMTQKIYQLVGEKYKNG